MTRPTDNANAEHRSTLIIRSATSADGTPLVWIGPILAHVDPDPGDDLDVWVNGPYGIERIEAWLLCDEEADTDSGFCDAPPVACIGGDLSPICVAHLPESTVVPPVEDIDWRIVEWVDDASAYIEQIAATALAAHAFCQANPGHDVSDLLSAGLRHAARTLGGSTELVRHRPGSWEATHVTALARGLDEC